jgi:tRNA/rRNA methyltransferase
LDACRVVLVRPEIAANIGATARVMRNMGARDLVLVAPVADPHDERARMLATRHGEAILEQSRIVPDLQTALADCLLVAGTSARTGGLFRRQTVGPPETIAEHLVESMPGGPVAIVFGPEPSGLSNEEIQLCPHLIHIPAEEDHPALNLAQAVAVCLYEIRRVWLNRQPSAQGVEETVRWEQMAHLFADLRTALTEVRYLRGVRGEALMHALRHLIARARPTPMEVGLLFGLARQLRWVAERANLEDEPPAEEGSKT